MTTQDTAPVPAVPAQPAGTPGPAGTPEPAPKRRRALVAVLALLLVAGVGGGSAFYLRAAGYLSSAAGSPASAARGSHPAAAATAPMPTATFADLQQGLAPYQAPLTLSVSGGTLTTVDGTGPDASLLVGSLTPGGQWTSTTPLMPSATYNLVAHVRDAAGTMRSIPLPISTTPAATTFGVTILPGDAAVVGTGQAVSVRLATPVTDKALRAVVERALTVTTVPAVTGSWRWVSSTELRYRGPDLWAAHTAITVSTALAHVQLAGLWGPASRTSSFTVGNALTSVVDVTAHTMTVSQDGTVVRVMKASMGKPGFDTRNGTFVVLETFANKIMDSATVDLPPGTPAYKTAVKDAVRITNSGTFVHGAPWSVGSQGLTNVSHGCVNLSPADALWFYSNVTRGDIVTVVHSTVGPNLYDAGSQDWNMTFDQWKSGSALA